MNGFDTVISNIARLGSEIKPKEGDYYKDGLLYCGKCGVAKECVHEYPLGSGKLCTFPCTCQCDKNEEAAYQKRLAYERQEHNIKTLQHRGITDARYSKYTFEADDGHNPEITERCKRYVAMWSEMKEKSNGILFYGGVGTGKSFYACCIANALLKEGVPVLVTSLPKLVKQANDKYAEPINLGAYDLLVLDDLGVENSTQTAYNIINAWYLSNKPLIVTTNLTPKQLKNPDSVGKERIYDRVVEMCCSAMIPITGESRRRQVVAAKRADKAVMELMA